MLRLFILLLLSQTALAQHSGWSSYGGDAGGNRYSSNNQINDSNVHLLQPAWTFRTHELEKYAGTDALSKAAFEATPILVDNTIFFSTPTNVVFAIDPTTGQQKWKYDPQVDLKNDFSEIASRGVTAWPLNSLSLKYSKRIFFTTIDGRLIALNLADGKPITTFGNNGTIDLREGRGKDISSTSPPVTIGNLVITGSSLGDNQSAIYPHGVVRAFNAITGKQVWEWDPVSFDSSNRSGAANVWAMISVDEKRDLVFVPTSSPSPDYYGGHRPGANQYGNSIVALNSKTGKTKWSYQVVHHDIWDYDIAAQPVLITLKKGKKSVDAVAVGTKWATYLFLTVQLENHYFPVEERQVPASTIEGETAFATQPFPVLPKPLGIQKISVEDAWGPTPELQKIAAERIGRYINNGPFTPPSLKGTLVTPGNVGGIHWGGMCFDPAKGILYTNINRLAAIIRLIPRDSLEVAVKKDQQLLRQETGAQKGTPYILKRDYLFSIVDKFIMMQSKPPFGTLNAIDLNTGANKWEEPLGSIMDTTRYPDAKKWGSLNFGGSIVTAGNLVFVAATHDNHLRAFNADTGKLLWEYLLPASAQATPMTYSVNGKQYLVIAAGGHGKFMSKQGDYVMAFALP